MESMGTGSGSGCGVGPTEVSSWQRGGPRSQVGQRKPGERSGAGLTPTRPAAQGSAVQPQVCCCESSSRAGEAPNTGVHRAPGLYPPVEVSTLPVFLLLLSPEALAVVNSSTVSFLGFKM